MCRTAGFVKCCGDVFWRRFGNQTPEKTAVAFSRSAAFAHRRGELEFDVASGLNCRRDPDRAEPALGHNEHLIRLFIAVVIERANYRTKTNGYPVDAGDVQRPDGVAQVEPVFVSEQAVSRRARQTFERSRLQKAGAAGAQRNIVFRIADHNRAGSIEDAVDRGRADIDDFQWNGRNRQGSETKQQSKQEFSHWSCIRVMS